MSRYVEPGGTWRPFWLVAGVLVALLALDLLAGPGLGPLAWTLVLVAVPGVVAAGVLAGYRARTVRVDGGGADPALTVGRERVPLTDVDGAHLRAVAAGTAGVDAGAPVLGGGWSVPRGRSGLPLRLADGRTVLVPTRDPAALTTALLTAVPDTGDGHSGRKGTLGS
jgi:hypothetical protein